MSENDKRTTEYFIYILFEPKPIAIDQSYDPICYIGVSPTPLEAYDKYLKDAGNDTPMGQWIQEMDDLCGEKPAMRILESIRSAYTRNDKYTLREAWRWVAVLSGSQLLKGDDSYDISNFDNLGPGLQSCIGYRMFGLRFGKDRRYFSEINTHGDTFDSVNPLFGYSLVTTAGDVINFKDLKKRDRELDKAKETEETWQIPENPDQRREHLEIVEEKAARRHPKKLAKWKARPILEKARDWQQLKKDLWEWRWTIHRLPRGAVLFDGKYPVK